MEADDVDAETLGSESESSLGDVSSTLSIALPSVSEIASENARNEDELKETVDIKDTKGPLLCWFDGLLTKNPESDEMENVEGDDPDEKYGLVPEVLLSRARMNAAKLTRNGDYAEAVDEKIRAVALTRIIYGDINVQVARAYAELAEGYLKLRKLPLQALKHSEYSRDILLEIEASKSQDEIGNRVETAAVLELIYFIMGKANKVLKHYKNADNLLQKAHLVQTKKANDCGATVVDSYKTLEALLLLGEVSRLRKQHGHAMEWFEKAIELVEVKFGSESSELIGLHHQIGKTELQLGKHANFQRVYESYEKARKIASAAYGNLSLQYADSCLCLAKAYIAEQNRLNFSLAETALEEAFSIYTSKHGKSYRKTLEVQENLCQLLLQERKYKEAESMINSLLRGKLEKYGEISESVADTYRMLGGLFLSQNKYELAMPNLTKSMEIYKVVLGVQNKKTRRISKVIESIKKSPVSSKLNIPEEKLKGRPRFNNMVSGPKSFTYKKME